MKFFFPLVALVLHDSLILSCQGLISPPILHVVKRTLVPPPLFVAPPNEEEHVIENDAAWYPTEMVEDDEWDIFDDEEWMPDREKARKQREVAQRFYEQVKKSSVKKKKEDDKDAMEDTKAADDLLGKKKEEDGKKSVYTEEEEELIEAMGGRKSTDSSKREPGYLGDSTLEEIARDYSVPVSYLADVLCTWGVPVPIRIQDRLGDLVTGEQAFAVLEAMHSLDIATLQDRYSNRSLLLFCDYHDIPLKVGFQMAIKEGWSLPFGVQTCLRVEQEDEMLRVLGSDFYEGGDEDEYYDS